MTICNSSEIAVVRFVPPLFNVLNKHSMAAHHTLNNGRTMPLPYWVYLLLGRVNFTIMHRNPAKVRQLKETISLKESELIELKHQLKNELELVPVGYELIGSGDTVAEGALGYEPYHGNWTKAGNSVGKMLNEQGYVTGITHRGWRYANPA